MVAITIEIDSDRSPPAGSLPGANLFPFIRVYLFSLLGAITFPVQLTDECSNFMNDGSINRS